MYQDGILSWLVWFKMEVQQRRQVNRSLTILKLQIYSTQTVTPQNERSVNKIFILQLISVTYLNSELIQIKALQ